MAKEPTGASAGSSGASAATAGAPASAGTPAVNGGSAGGSSAGTTAQGGSGANAGTTPISCDWNFLAMNVNGIGAGCTGESTAAEVAACLGNFCTRRVLADRWPASTPEQFYSGHCSKHCQTASDCGSGFVCCEPRPGPFCVRYREGAVHGSGCSERCATDHLGCAEGEICCERMGKICISDGCEGVCP
ncbi:MAG TPA: hypothetical protein VJV79_38335 [Polyangiaceae bacterium]|nr:hypothetical protein [Polyangiaceae bacterium]